jgi:hypothetical protein
MPITRLRANLQLKADSVSADRIRDATITAADIAPNTLDGAMFVNGSIPHTKLDISAMSGTGLIYNSGSVKLDVNVDNSSIEIFGGQLKTKSSVVTHKGNTFNGASQLVELLADGRLPALDGSLLFNVSGGGGGSAGWADDGSAVRLLDDADSVGIGTALPGSKLDVAGALTLRGMSAPSVAPSGQARVYFDSGSATIKISENGSPYAGLVVGSNFVDLETPSGFIDGVNTVFALSATPVSGSLHLYLNGVLLFHGASDDYTISGATITTIGAPPAGSRLAASYRKA